MGVKRDRERESVRKGGSKEGERKRKGEGWREREKEREEFKLRAMFWDELIC